MNPLVVTLALDAQAQARFDRERRQWFPAGATQVGAHVTLFHAVPGDLEQDARDALAEQAGPAFEVRVTKVMSLGRGAAYGLESGELAGRHRVLQRRWWERLTSQDRQPLRPHVTVANKVAPERARATVEALRADFVPYDVTATGFALWRYDGGPWTHLDTVEFTA